MDGLGSISASSAEEERLQTNPLKQSDLKKLLAFNLRKHDSTICDYDKNMIDNIIFDEKKHIVALFKDSLLWNEPTELLRR